MGKKAQTQSYTLELPLHVSIFETHRLEKKLRIARMIYNTCLHEALKRHKAVKANKSYRLWLAQPSSQKRNDSCNTIRLTHGFSAFDLHTFVAEVQRKFKEHIGSLEAQKLASRAFEAVEKLHFGRSKRVHFKQQDEDLSVEGKNNTTGLRFVNGYLLWGSKPSKKNPKPKNWLRIPVQPKPKDKYAQQALQDRTKYVRLLRREIRGKVRYFVQLVQEGIPPKKPDRIVANDETQRVGLDIGPSTIAIVSEVHVALHELAPECKIDEQQKRVLERAMDRSKRATNMNNFHPNGTVKQGAHSWTFSNRYKKLRQKRKERYRKIRVARKMSHERLANDILQQGSDIRVETMRFQSLQKKAKATTRNKQNGKINRKKRFGKSIGHHAPALLLTILDRKLGYQGRSLKEIETYAVKASQFNHITGEYNKKTLGQRWNELGIQRDLYSAFMICHTSDTLDKVDMEACNRHWYSFVEQHNQEIERLKQTANPTLRWFIA